jgi:SRSO17 transposase
MKSTAATRGCAPRWRNAAPATSSQWLARTKSPQAPGSSARTRWRNRSTGELAYYRCYSPAAVPLTTLVRVAGSRWRVEEFFQSGKGLAALDEHQVRRYSSWSRWVTLAMLAHAFLAVVRANEHDRHPSPDGLIPLTCKEIQRLFITLVIQRVLDPVHQLGWSVWRRRHQARSQTSHYRRQAAQA